MFWKLWEYICVSGSKSPRKVYPMWRRESRYSVGLQRLVDVVMPSKIWRFKWSWVVLNFVSHLRNRKKNDAWYVGDFQTQWHKIWRCRWRWSNTTLPARNLHLHFVLKVVKFPDAAQCAFFFSRWSSTYPYFLHFAFASSQYLLPKMRLFEIYQSSRQVHNNPDFLAEKNFRIFKQVPDCLTLKNLFWRKNFRILKQVPRLFDR